MTPLPHLRILHVAFDFARGYTYAADTIDGILEHLDSAPHPEVLAHILTQLDALDATLSAPGPRGAGARCAAHRHGPAIAATLRERARHLLAVTEWHAVAASRVTAGVGEAVQA